MNHRLERKDPEIRDIGHVFFRTPSQNQPRLAQRVIPVTLDRCFLRSIPVVDEVHTTRPNRTKKIRQQIPISPSSSPHLYETRRNYHSRNFVATSGVCDGCDSAGVVNRTGRPSKW